MWYPESVENIKIRKSDQGIVAEFFVGLQDGEKEIALSIFDETATGLIAGLVAVYFPSDREK